MFDGGNVYYTDQHLISGPQDQFDNDRSFAETENKFMHFVRETQVRNTYIYREQLRSNAQRGNYFLKIDIEHLMNFDEQLVSVFRQKPADYIKVFERAVEAIYRTDYMDELSPELYEAPKFQVQVSSDENPLMLRDL